MRWLNLSEAEGGVHAAAAAAIRTVQGVVGAEDVMVDLLQRISASLNRDVEE